MLTYLIRKSHIIETFGGVAGLTAGSLSISCPILLQSSFPTHALSAPFLVQTFLISSFLTTAVYNADRWNDNAADTDTPERGQSWGGSNPRRGAISVLLPMALCVATVLTNRENGSILYPLLLVIALFFAGLIYTFPASTLLPFLGDKWHIRIKDIPCIKAFYVAFIWAAGMFVPAALCLGVDPQIVLTYSGYIFLRVVPACTAGDIRDVRADRAARLLTLPIAFGIRPTILAMGVVNVVAALWVLTNVFNSSWPRYGLILVFSCAFGAAIWLYLSRHKDRVLQVQAMTVIDLLLTPLIILIGKEFL